MKPFVLLLVGVLMGNCLGCATAAVAKPPERRGLDVATRDGNIDPRVPYICVVQPGGIFACIDYREFLASKIQGQDL